MTRSVSKLVSIPWPWLCYIGLLFMLSSGQLLRKLLTDTGGPPSRYGGLFAVVLILVFVSAWVNQRPLGKQWHWKIVLFLLGFLVAVGLGFTAMLLVNGIFQSAAFLGVGMGLLLPALYALFQYVYRSPGIWKSYGEVS